MTVNPCEFVYIDVLFIQLIGLTTIKPVCLPHNMCVQVLYFVCILFSSFLFVFMWDDLHYFVKCLRMIYDVKLDYINVGKLR